MSKTIKKTMNTRELLNKLESEGYSCKYSNLQSYIRERLITPIKKRHHLSWGASEITKVKSLLTGLGRGPELNK